jgi:hypothetical protein
MFTFKWSNTSEITTDSISGTIFVGGAKFLLTSDFLVVRIPEKSFRTNAVRTMTVSLADCVSSANDWTLANVFAFALTQV